MEKLNYSFLQIDEFQLRVGEFMRKIKFANRIVHLEAEDGRQEGREKIRTNGLDVADTKADRSLTHY